MEKQIEKIVNDYAAEYENAKERLPGAEIVGRFARHIDELRAIAAKALDFQHFSDLAQKSDIFIRLGEIAQEAARMIADAQAAPAERKRPVKDELLRQYRAGYDAVKDQPHMIRTRLAYERFFEMAETATDIIDLQTRAEEMRLSFEITRAPLIDTHQLLFERHDPNLLLLRDRNRAMIDAAETARSADELAGRIERVMQTAKKAIAREEVISYAVVLLADRLLSYDIAKANARAVPEEFLGSFIIARKEARMAYEALVGEFGLDWDALVAAPRHVRRLLIFADITADTTLVAASMDPQNLAWMREMLFEEILSDKNPAALLLRRSDRVFNPSIAAEEADAARAKTAAAGWERIRHYPWADTNKLLS